jgi:polysaccharide export outer membrane protein
MVRRLIILILTCLSLPFLDVVEANQGAITPFNQKSDFLEVKASENEIGQGERYDSRESSRSRRNRRTLKPNSSSSSVKYKEDAGIFDVDKITKFKVLRDDQVVELRNPRSGKLEIKIVKANALPEEMQNRHDLEYTLMELDQLEVVVNKHDETPQVVRVGWDGKFSYPLIGEIQAKGLTIPQVELELERRFKEYVKIPVVTASVTKKSPLARVLVVGTGFKEYEGHEKILDILGADYEPTWENVYDKVCVVRKNADGSLVCIVVDMEHMFTKYDFRQNIPIKAGDIVLVKKMPPLFGRRFKFWWHQVLSWLNEVDEFLNAVKSIHEWELED